MSAVILRDLIHSQEGRAAVVMGGGPSLPWAFVPFFDSLGLPADPLLLSANQHGCRLSEHGLCRQPDYIVAVDNIEGRLRQYGVPIVAAREWADVMVFQKPVHNSGMFGCWVAWVMGCFPIIPLGMDLYQDGVYFDDPGAESNGTEIPVEVQLERWRHVRRVLEGDWIRVLPGSRLAEIFPVYDPGARRPQRIRHDTMVAHTSGQRVELLQGIEFRGRPRRRGTELEVPPRVAAKWIRTSIAVAI